MSKMPTFDNANVAGMVASNSAARSPVRRPKNRVPTQAVSAIKPIAASADGNRAANSVPPNSQNAVRCSQ